MQNVWKGLIIGAVAGAGVGIVLDGIYGSGRIGRELAIQGRARLADAHLGDRAQHAASDLADSVRSDLVPAAKEAVAATTSSVRSDLAPAAKDALVSAGESLRSELAPAVDAVSEAVQDKVRG